MLFFNFISCTEKINLQKNQILCKKLFNHIIWSKWEVFGEYFVNKSEKRKMVGRKVVPVDVINHPLQCGQNLKNNKRMTLHISRVPRIQGGGGGGFIGNFSPDELRACEHAQRQFLNFCALDVLFVCEIMFIVQGWCFLSIYFQNFRTCAFHHARISPKEKLPLNVSPTRIAQDLQKFNNRETRNGDF